MKERPILFSAPMVRAILEGRKTQTRRIVKNMPPEVVGGYFDAYNKENAWNWWTNDHRPSLPQIKCPYGKALDKLWVRETWAPDYEPHTFIYKADDEARASSQGGRWRPSIHMPRWASRITLEVVSVTVERLQEISEADALAEGVSGDTDITIKPNLKALVGIGYSGPARTARNAYHWLWDSINDPRSWDANPWVWVVEFKRIAP